MKQNKQFLNLKESFRNVIEHPLLFGKKICLCFPTSAPSRQSVVMMLRFVRVIQSDVFLSITKIKQTRTARKPLTYRVYTQQIVGSRKKVHESWER